MTIMAYCNHIFHSDMETVALQLDLQALLLKDSPVADHLRVLAEHCREYAKLDPYKEHAEQFNHSKS